MRFLATFEITCSFERWLKLVDDLKPHMDKHGLKLITAMSNEDQTRVYDLGEAETMAGVEAFVCGAHLSRTGRRGSHRPTAGTAPPRIFPQ